MKKKVALFLFAVSAIAFLSNCGGNKQESHDHEHADSATSENPASESTGSPQFSVDAAFQQQLAAVFTSYISLKEGFIASSAAKVKTEAVAMQQSLSKTDMKLLTGAAHHDWMTYLGGMESSLKEMENATDIEVQRTAFATLSNNLYNSIKAYGLGGITAYYEFCPMAFDNKGGFWLSNEEKIRNPYFGDMMLTCGEVKEKL